uniref:Dual specificity protein phosphatase n=1 Tax=Cacopsylla melanoneura TaxID=428564 RepID=A0A8D8PVY1_9HEMI
MSAASLLKSDEDAMVAFEKQLNEIISTVRPQAKPLPGYDGGDCRHDMDLDCDEVYPNIFLSDGLTAKNKEYLKRIGVTHVVNAAKGRKFGMVNTTSDYYKDVGIKFLGLELMDLPIANISCHFRDVADFIEDVLDNKGKLVNILNNHLERERCLYRKHPHYVENLACHINFRVPH